MSGRLIVIPTPIGNLGDLSPRAEEALQSVDLLLCEDTRHTGRLLQRLEIRVPLASYHRFNEAERTRQVRTQLREGKIVGLVSDAGTPGFSDPGERIIAAVVADGLPVDVLPGPNAALTALVGSGLPALPCLMIGFLSREGNEAERQWEEMAKSKATIVLYESPKRIHETVARLHEVLGDRRAVIARELTKLHEEYIRGKLSDWVEDPDRIPTLGEMVLVVAPGEEAPLHDARALLEEALQTMPLSRAVRKLSALYDLPKNELYTLGLALEEEKKKDR